MPPSVSRFHGITVLLVCTAHGRRRRSARLVNDIVVLIATVARASGVFGFIATIALVIAALLSRPQLLSLLISPSFSVLSLAYLSFWPLSAMVFGIVMPRVDALRVSLLTQITSSRPANVCQLRAHILARCFSCPGPWQCGHIGFQHLVPCMHPVRSEMLLSTDLRLHETRKPLSAASSSRPAILHNYCTDECETQRTRPRWP